jgi:hypothetical protein
MLLRELLGAGQVEVADADNLGFIKKLDRLSVNGANPTASDQPKPNLGHRFAYPSRGQSSSKRTRLLRQRARKDFRTALSGVWIVRPPSTVRTAPVKKTPHPKPSTTRLRHLRASPIARSGSCREWIAPPPHQLACRARRKDGAGAIAFARMPRAVIQRDVRVRALIAALLTRKG